MEQTQAEQKSGLLGVVLVGTGSLLGTGIFVAIGFGANLAGSWLLPALVLAAVVAMGTALSHVSLATADPSGVGAYDYGYKYLNSGIGYTAGWASLMASTTAASAAALGYSGYVIQLLRRGEPGSAMTIAVGAVAGLSLLILSGFQRGRVANILIASAGALALLVFIGCMSSRTAGMAGSHLAFANAGVASPAQALFGATALLFPAYVGFSQITRPETLGTTSRGTLVTGTLISLGIALVLYLATTAVAVAVVGSPVLAQQTEKTVAPLAALAERYNPRWVGQVISAGAVLAMLGVVLNRIVAGARVAQAMGARNDLPVLLSKRDSAETPYVATVLVGLAVGALVAFTDVHKSWSYAAFSALTYAALTNLAALKLDQKERVGSKVISGAALVACLGLVFVLPFDVWATGIVVLLGGHVLRLLWVAFRPASANA